MEIEQYSLKFTGKRFAQHTLPISVLPEFEIFQKIVEILAGDIWKENNSERERLPRGFAKNLQLGITEIREGSAVAALEPIYNTDLFQSREIEKAILETSELFASNDNFEAARNASPHIKRYLRKFGGSLREGEGVALLRSVNDTDPLFVFDPLQRSRMIRALSTSERTIQSYGKLLSTKIDDEWQKGRVEIFNPAFGTFHVNEDPDRVKDEFDGSLHNFVEFGLVAEIGLSGEIRKVVQVDSLELVSSEKLGVFKEKISNFVGLVDPELKIPIRADIAEKCIHFLDKYPDIAIRSSIVPGLEGNILIEMDLNEWDITIEIRNDGRIEFYGYNLSHSDDPAAEFFNTFPDLNDKVYAAITERERETW